MSRRRRDDHKCGERIALEASTFGDCRSPMSTRSGEPVIMLPTVKLVACHLGRMANRLVGQGEIFAPRPAGGSATRRNPAGATPWTTTVAMLEEFVGSRGLDGVALVGNCMGCAYLAGVRGTQARTGEEPWCS